MLDSINNRRSLIALSLMVAIAVAIFVFGFRHTIAAQTSDEAVVRDVLLKSAQGFERNDLALLNKIWANDEALTVFEQGHANYGWTDYRDNHLVPEMREMKNTKYALDDMKIHLAGKTAWATFKYTISADVDKKHISGGGLGSAVLEARDGRWQIVHWHSSAPRRPPTSSPTPAKKTKAK
ncbi:MAG: nuclear transport factor 2 family protein [Pyrinomonadaceae bacterium]